MWIARLTPLLRQTICHECSERLSTLLLKNTKQTCAELANGLTCGAFKHLACKKTVLGIAVKQQTGKRKLCLPLLDRHMFEFIKLNISITAPDPSLCEFYFQKSPGRSKFSVKGFVLFVKDFLLVKSCNSFLDVYFSNFFLH